MTCPAFTRLTQHHLATPLPESVPFHASSLAPARCRRCQVPGSAGRIRPRRAVRRPGPSGAPRPARLAGPAPAGPRGALPRPACAAPRTSDTHRTRRPLAARGVTRRGHRRATPPGGGGARRADLRQTAAAVARGLGSPGRPAPPAAAGLGVAAVPAFGRGGRTRPGTTAVRGPRRGPRGVPVAYRPRSFRRHRPGPTGGGGRAGRARRPAHRGHPGGGVAQVARRAPRVTGVRRLRPPGRPHRPAAPHQAGPPGPRSGRARSGHGGDPGRGRRRHDTPDDFPGTDGPRHPEHDGPGAHGRRDMGQHLAGRLHRMAGPRLPRTRPEPPRPRPVRMDPPAHPHHPRPRHDRDPAGHRTPTALRRQPRRPCGGAALRRPAPRPLQRDPFRRAGPGVERRPCRRRGRHHGGGRHPHARREHRPLPAGPWVAEAETRDLLHPDVLARALHVSKDGVTDRVPTIPASENCDNRPVLQLRSSERIAEHHAFLLAPWATCPRSTSPTPRCPGTAHRPPARPARPPARRHCWPGPTRPAP